MTYVLINTKYAQTQNKIFEKRYNSLIKYLQDNPYKKFKEFIDRVRDTIDYLFQLSQRERRRRMWLDVELDPKNLTCVKLPLEMPARCKVLSYTNVLDYNNNYLCTCMLYLQWEDGKRKRNKKSSI